MIEAILIGHLKQCGQALRHYEFSGWTDRANQSSSPLDLQISCTLGVPLRPVETARSVLALT